MILPTKRIIANRTLLGIGGELLNLLDDAKTTSRLWGEFKSTRKEKDFYMSYDWFVLALDFLYLIGAVRFEYNKVKRSDK